MSTHIGDLKPDPKNARRHTPRNVGTIVTAMHEVGAARSIVIDEDNVILAGNATIEAAAQAGIERLRVIDADGDEIIAVRRRGLTADQKTRLALFDNRAAELAEWDTDVLSGIAAEMDLTAIGFSAIDLDALLGTLSAPPATDPGAQVDRAAELQEKWRVQRGDLWQIGRHRLLCGNATDAGDVARVMGGEQIAAVFTSPPYLQQRTYNGNMSADWHGLLTGVFGAAIPHLASDAQMFINLGLVHESGRVIRYWDSLIDWLEAEGLPLFGWYVWDKLNGMPGDWNGRLAPAHEWVFHFTRDAQRPAKTVASKHAGDSVGTSQRNPDGTLKRFTGERDPIQPFKIPDSVIRVNQQRPDELINNHPAPFPVALPAAFLEAWALNPWYDPFVGSGTTIVAAEQEGRMAYAMEIDPKYCAVVLERLAGMGLDVRRAD